MLCLYHATDLAPCSAPATHVVLAFKDTPHTWDVAEPDETIGRPAILCALHAQETAEKLTANAVRAHAVTLARGATPPASCTPCVVCGDDVLSARGQAPDAPRRCQRCQRAAGDDPGDDAGQVALPKKPRAKRRGL